MFNDFHVNNEPKLIKEAARLGYSGIAVFNEGRNPATDETGNWKTSKEDYSIKIYNGVLIQAKNPDDMRQKVNKSRGKADIIMVVGGDQKINRAACEDPRVDVISKPYFKRKDCGINHVIAKKAAINQVAVELNIKHLTKTSPYLHYKVLSYYREIVKLKRKFDFPLIITSHANSIYDLHTPKDLMALAACFGMEPEESTSAMVHTPMNIIERSRQRDKIIVEGVKRLD